MFANRKEKIHFIGIGGIGMSAIASILKSMNFFVTGSDISMSEKSKSLENTGIKVYYGHNATNLESDVSVVVTSSAISPVNEEVVEAKKRNITIISRGEMLAELMRLRYGIAISGTHGKTTTTSLISQIMIEANLEPVCVIGGNHFNLGSNVNFSSKEKGFLICEADESDGSFLNLSPVISVVTNIDNDHLDHYGNMEELRSSFLQFMNKVPFYGASFLCFDNEIVRDVAKSVVKKYYSYGFDESYDYYVDPLSIKTILPYTYFTVYRKNERIGEFKTKLLGRHNVLNSLAAISVAHYLNIDYKTIKLALEKFEGVSRRLNCLYDKDITIFDDYAHHPTEIRTTLKAIRDTYPNRRIISIFQPHRYSRTKMLFNDFAQSFNDVDVAVITGIYAAGESPIAGISGEIIYKALKDVKSDCLYIEDINNIKEFLDKNKKDNDIIITLGAGNIVNVGKGYANYLSCS